MPRLIKNTIQILLFIFLLLQIIPLLKREIMQTILILDYSIVLSLIFFISIKMKNWENPLKYFSLMALVFLSFLLYVFGFSGSISGYILCASLPYFLFNRLYSYQDIVNVFFVPVKWAAIFLIVFGAILFYDLRNDLMNMKLMVVYFIKASINYVSLLFYGVSMLYLLMYELKKKSSTPPSRLDFIIGAILISSCVVYSFAYWTRSTFIMSGLLLFLHFRRYKAMIFLTIVSILILFRDAVSNYFLIFMGFGGDVKKIALQDVRVDSVNNLVNNAISFNYDFSNTMSDSSFMNVLFCLFPFTLLFAYEIICSLLNLIMIRNLYISTLYGFLFLISLFITIYQMDFLSVFVLFMLVEVIFFENRRSHYLN